MVKMEEKLRGPRSRERKIKDVVEKVWIWRKSSQGFYLNGIYCKRNLEQAAENIDIPKKTLDEYFYLIRYISLKI